MYSDNFQDLKKRYTETRDSDMSEDQFAALLYTFPAILVAYADGRIDPDEKDFMQSLPGVLTEGYMENGVQKVVGATLTQDYFDEVEYIIRHLDEWEELFLMALREQLHNSQNERNAIFEMMWRTADSSEDISEVEKQKIDQISSKMSL